MHGLIIPIFRLKTTMILYYIANTRMPTEKAHGSQIAKMCESFAEKGADVRLIVPRRLNPIKEDVFSYYGLKKNFRIVRLSTFDLVRFGRIGFWIQAFTFALSVRFLAEIPPEALIYSRDHIPLFFIRSLPPIVSKKTRFSETFTCPPKKPLFGQTP